MHRTIKSVADLEACHELIRALLDSLHAHKLHRNSSKCSILAKFAGRQAAAVQKLYVTWTTILTARPIAGEGGMVAIGCGEGENFGPLERGTNLQGALSALFGKMWDHPPLSDLAQDRDRFLLIAHSVKAIYDHMARKMELMARLIISRDNKRVLVKRNCGDSQQYLEKHPGAAPKPTTHKRGPLSNAATSTVKRPKAARAQDLNQPHPRRRAVLSGLRSRRILRPAALPATGPGTAGTNGTTAMTRPGQGGMMAGAVAALTTSDGGSA